MRSPDTCWTLIRRAAEGNPSHREEFARLYSPVVRAYLGARWRGSRPDEDIDDAQQEVFLDCLREGGALERADPAWPGGFRSFLHGVVRNVALRFERKQAGAEPDLGALDPDTVPASEESLSRAFDRAWAQALVHDAAARQATHAREEGEAAGRRVELLRLRFFNGLPIRDIARLWGVEPRVLHEEHRKARLEFHAALLEVVAFHHPGATAGDLEREGRNLIAALDGG